MMGQSNGTLRLNTQLISTFVIKTDFCKNIFLEVPDVTEKHLCSTDTESLGNVTY